MIAAGIGRMTAEEIKNNPALQAKFVSVVRVHPMFEYSLGPGAPDDVAVLTLEKPLILNATVAAIRLPSVVAGSLLTEGASMMLTGFGEQRYEQEPNMNLYSLAMTVGSPRSCGGEADAVFVCASSQAGSACSGDSGSALANTNASPVALAGVMDTIQRVNGTFCVAGAVNGFVNTSAPEIREFIEGSESPKRASRGGNAFIYVTDPPPERAGESRGEGPFNGVSNNTGVTVGQSLGCTAGNWSGEPMFTYTFMDSASKQVLQQGGTSTYAVSNADVGRTIFCEVQAANAGGVGVGKTGALTNVKAPPPPPPPANNPPPAPQAPSRVPEAAFSTVSLVTASLPAQRDASALVKLSCEGGETCTGKLILKVRSSSKMRHGRKATRLVKIGSGSFSIVAGMKMSAKITLNGAGRALLKSAHGRLTAQLSITETALGETQTVTVHLLEQSSHARGKRKK